MLEIHEITLRKKKKWKCFWCTWILSKGKVLFVLLSRYFQSRIIVIVILIRNELQYRLNVCIGWSVMNFQLLRVYFNQFIILRRKCVNIISICTFIKRNNFVVAYIWYDYWHYPYNIIIKNFNVLYDHLMMIYDQFYIHPKILISCIFSKHQTTFLYTYTFVIYNIWNIEPK